MKMEYSSLDISLQITAKTALGGFFKTKLKLRRQQTGKKDWTKEVGGWLVCIPSYLEPKEIDIFPICG